MKNTLYLVVAIFTGIAIISCGPSKEEIEAREKLIKDIENAKIDSILAMEVASSSATIETSAKTKADSMLKVIEAVKKGGKKK
jgi:hypothetical protein